jgi:hypothetical protein
MSQLNSYKTCRASTAAASSCCRPKPRQLKPEPAGSPVRKAFLCMVLGYLCPKHRRPLTAVEIRVRARARRGTEHADRRRSSVLYIYLVMILVWEI